MSVHWRYWEHAERVMGMPGGGGNEVISASFEGVVKEAQAGNVYTVIIAFSLFGVWTARSSVPCEAGAKARISAAWTARLKPRPFKALLFMSRI
jgi:hypothetical protein